VRAGDAQPERSARKYDFRDDRGVRHVKQTFRTREEAERALRDCHDKVDRGAYVPASELPKFSTIAEEWFDSKRAYWRTHLDLHLLPEVGQVRLDRIDPPLVERRVRDVLVSAVALSELYIVYLTWWSGKQSGKKMVRFGVDGRGGVR